MSAEASSKAVWEYSQKYLTERMGDIHLIATHLHGPGVIHKKGDPIMAPSDLAGVKLRGPSRQANKLLETLGATPVGIPVPAFPEALSKGVVDGGVIPWEIVPPLKVHELADSHTEIGGDRALYNTFFVWGMNKAKYDSLPDDLKAVIDANSGMDVSAWAGRAMDTGDKSGRALTAGTDNKIVTLEGDALEELKAIGVQLTDEWIAEMDDNGLDGKAMVADAQALIAKHAN
jgi:TRAP-type C4-dicarboxylate transport system substrate-binding protein